MGRQANAKQNHGNTRVVLNSTPSDTIHGASMPVQEDDLPVIFLDRLYQPLKGQSMVAQTSINAREIKRCDIRTLSLRPQLIQRSKGFRPLARQAVSSA